MDPGTLTLLSTLISTFGPQVVKGLFGGGGDGQDPQLKEIMKLWDKSPYKQEFNPGQANQQFNEQVADPATKYFQERIQPNTRNQFFSPSGVNTTAMKKALTQGAEDLGGSLGSLRSNYLQNQQQNHAKGQYDLIAQQLGLVNNRSNQYGPQVGFGEALGEGINKLDWGSLLDSIFNKKDQPGAQASQQQQPNQMQQQVPQVAQQQSQYRPNMNFNWSVPGQLSSNQGRAAGSFEGR